MQKTKSMWGRLNKSISYLNMIRKEGNMIDKDKKKSRFDDDLEEDFDELDEIKDLDIEDDEDLDDLDDEPKEKDKKEDHDESDKKKKSKDEDLEEEDLFGTKVVVAVVIVAIVGILLFKIFSGNKEPNMYTVTFDANGTITTVEVKEDESVTKPTPDPTREGYVFVGWYYNGVLFDFSTRITSDIKLEARWLSDEEAKVSGVTLNLDKLTLGTGGTATLIATVTPDTALDKTLVWLSNDTSIVTVDANGKVTAVGAGTTTITVKTNDGNFTATVTVTVSKDVVQVTGVTLNRTTMNVAVNETIALTATVAPSDASNKAVVWSSSNTTVATVDANGRVTGKKDGTAVITVTTVDGSFTASVTVTVATEAVKGIAFTNCPATLLQGNAVTLAVKWTPANASNKNLTWSVTNGTGTATVNNGRVTAGSPGSVTVIAKSVDGNYTATCNINITAPVVTTTYRYVATAQKDEFGVTTAYTLKIYEKIGTAAETEVTSGTTVTAPFVNTATVKIISTTELDKIATNSNRINIVYGGKEINNVTGTINR